MYKAIKKTPNKVSYSRKLYSHVYMHVSMLYAKKKEEMQLFINSTPCFPTL